jgi:hypothetical protein
MQLRSYEKIVIRVLTRTILGSADHSGRDKNVRQVLPVFSKTHTHIHREHRITVQPTLEGKSDCELQVAIF